MNWAPTRISARSERQAMDWSLVLVSQGIDTTIERCPDTHRWELVVSAQDSESAFKALRQYRLENRGWPWRQHVPGADLLFDWGCLAWVLLVMLFSLLDAHRNLHSAGYMDSTLVAHGQWWRLFTAIWLHADLGHLATNATIGVVLLGLAMGRYGTGVGLLVSYLAGVGGNLVAWWLSSQPHHSLGASGMVMGSLGLLAAQSLSYWRHASVPARHAVTGLLGGFMMFILLGLSPGSDIAAHFGGFVSGLVLGGLLVRWPAIADNSKTNALCGLLFGLLVLAPWWLASLAAK